MISGKGPWTEPQIKGCLPTYGTLQSVLGTGVFGGAWGDVQVFYIKHCAVEIA